MPIAAYRPRYTARQQSEVLEQYVSHYLFACYLFSILVASASVDVDSGPPARFVAWRHENFQIIYGSFLQCLRTNQRNAPRDRLA